MFNNALRRISNIFMKLYNKYIFNKTAISFVSLASLLVILIWFSRTIAFVKYITENGVELQQFSLLFILILPWLLLFIIPISFFVAVLMVYNRLLLNNEITVLKNSGLTKIAIGKSTIVSAAALTLFCFSISFYFMPLANKKLRTTRNNFENNYSNISFSKGTFEGLKSLTIYVKDKDEQNHLSGILLHDERSSESVVTITARSGNLKFENGSLLLYMQDGTVQRLKYHENKEEILVFDDYVFNLTENSKTDRQFKRWKAKERFLSELINPDDDSEADDILQYKIELQQRLTYPLMSLVLAMIALAAILRGDLNRHGNNFNIVIASFFAVVFIAFTIAIYRLLETSLMLIPLLYLHFIIFFAVSFYILKSNSNEKKIILAKKN